MSAALTSTSNREEQLAGLRVQAQRGVPILHVSDGPTLRVSQDGTSIREGGPDSARVHVTAHPHLNAACAEAVDITVEQSPTDPHATSLSLRNSFVFENGDTRLVGEATRPDGTRRLVYATVFFPPCPPPCLP